MDFKDLLKRDLDDIVFEHRNRVYGAYALRKMYGQHIKKAVFVGGSFFLLLISGPLIADRIKPKEAGLSMKAVEMIELPKAEDLPKPPPPPPPPPPPQQIRTVTFLPPRVVENNVEENKEPIVPDVKDADISNKTQEGEIAENLAPLTEVAPTSVAPPVEPEPIKEVEDKPFLIVEEKPEFPDGEAAMMRFLSKNIKYPNIARENHIEGTVFISFVVAKDGSIQEVKFLRGIGGGCNEEAMRVVNMMPKWKPGRQQGRAVSVYFNLPVKFKLE